MRRPESPQERRKRRAQLAEPQRSARRATQHARLLEDVLLPRDFVRCGDAAAPQVVVDEVRALTVERPHADGPHGAAIGLEMYREKHDESRPGRERRRDVLHDEAADEHAQERDDGLLAGVLRVQLAQVAPAGEVRAEACFRGARGDAAEGAQDAAEAEDEDAEGFGEGGGQAVEDEGEVVEDVGEQAVHFALGL